MQKRATRTINTTVLLWGIPVLIIFLLQGSFLFTYRKKYLEAHYELLRVRAENKTTSVQPLQKLAVPETFYEHRIKELETSQDGIPLYSAKWAPWRISKCLDHMPKHWAPCVEIKGVEKEYGEEVFYPRHKVRLPGFVNEDNKRDFLHKIGTRGLIQGDDGYVHFHVVGQNFIFRNVRYTNNPYPDNWDLQTHTHCMGYLGTTSQFQSTKPSDKDRVHKELFLATTPQSSSYQHFSDHVFKIIVQAMHLITNDTDMLTSTAGLKSVQEMWAWFPVNSSRIIHGKSPSHFAYKLIHSCRCPFWHPYSVMRWQEIAVGPKSRTIPMSQRKVILYCSRNDDDPHRAHGGRRVLNEKELLPAIKQVLKERNKNETLTMLNLHEYKTYKDLAKFINANVKAIIGPHGGALMNLLWAAKDTVVIEFQHTRHINYAYWELAPLLEHNYWNLIYPPQGGTDMTVDIPSVVRILKDNLDVTRPEGHYIGFSYDWPKALEEAG